MRPDLETYYLIDQYLDNQLKGEDLIAFEHHLSQDASFAKEVAEQRMLNDLILEAELKGVRSQIEKDLINIQKPSFFRMNWQWIGAGLLSISTILYFSIPSKDDAIKTLQQSAKHPIEYTEQPVIEAKKETSTASDNATPGKSVPTTTPEVTKSINAATIIDSVHLSQKEVSVPAVSPVKTEYTPSIIATATEETKKTDCSVNTIIFSISTETSCQNSETGSIHIDKLSGGTAPYSYALNNKKIKEKNISDLAAGTYEVKISDKNGCSSMHIATILEKNCAPAIQQGLKFNINPTIGETCSIPFDTDKKGNVTIYNRSGKIIYRATNPSADVEWSGTDGYGALADAGLYVYLIEYTDGTKVTGEVNIIR